jgi:hypothetical protein
LSNIAEQANNRIPVWMPFLMSFKHSPEMVKISKHPLFTKDVLAEIMKLSVNSFGKLYYPYRIGIAKIDCLIDDIPVKYMDLKSFRIFFTPSIIELINSTQHKCINNCRLSHFVSNLNKIAFTYINLVCSSIDLLTYNEKLKIMVDEDKQANFVYCDNGITYIDGSYVSNPKNFKIHSTAFVNRNLHCVFSLKQINHHKFDDHKVYCFNEQGKIVISELYTLIPDMLSREP